MQPEEKRARRPQVAGSKTQTWPSCAKAELHEAAALMGVGRVEVFDWNDSEMEGIPAPGTLVAAPIEEVAARIASLIDDVQPTVVVTLDASDCHRDHAHNRDATLRATTSSSWRPHRVYLHCLPQKLMRKWVEALVEQHPESENLGLGELGTPEDQITTVVDSTRYLAVREQVIALHRSQTSPYEVMPTELRRQFLTAERLRRVQPAWNDGPIETEIFTGSNLTTATT